MAPISGHELYALTTRIADALEQVRVAYYDDCVGLVAGIEDVRPRPIPHLSPEGHFVIASFQMWLVFELMDARGDLYLEQEHAQTFVDLLYAKVLVPYLEGEPTPEALARGVQRFTALSREEATKPFEEFSEDRMRQLIFTGKCKYGVDGYWRSARDMGITMGVIEAITMKLGIMRLTTGLTTATRHVLAVAFGDMELAAQLTKSSGNSTP